MIKYEIDTDSYNRSFLVSIIDFTHGFNYYKIWFFLSCQDIKQRYRRSVIGPFWITISNAIIIAMLSFLYGALFGLPLDVYAPYLASGMLVWSFISVTINESTSLFSESRNIIQQVNYPLSFYTYRLISRNILILFHNLLIMPFIYFYFETTINVFNILLFFAGLLVLSINLFFISFCSAIICTRFRDIQPLITNIVQAVFFVSPIMWLPSILEARGVASWLLVLNPIYYLLDIVRSPMLGQSPSYSSVIVSFSLMIGLFLVTFMLLAKTKSKVVYWL